MFLSGNFLILLIIPIDLDILFFISVIWSAQYNFLSIITPKNLVLFKLDKF